MERSYVNKIVKVKTDSIVTLQQAKEQLNVEDDFFDDDSHISLLIENATGAAEDYTGCDLITTENTLEFIRYTGQSIQVFEAPFSSMISITATVDDIDTVIPSTDYEIQIRRTDFILMFNETVTADKLTLVFVTGYDRDEAPNPITSAILIKINDLYDLERASSTSGINYRDNKTFERLLNGHVINRW